MIDWLVFSRDRACQVDALLRSHNHHAGHLTSTIAVIYSYSTPEHGGAYELTRERHRAAWIHEGPGEFEALTREWLAWIAGPLLGFLVDDDLWTGTLPESVPTPFSPRLGRNTVRSMPLGCEQRVPHVLELDGVLSYKWRGADGDFGYPLSLDGHVYARETIAGLVEHVAFTDPTTLEAGLASIAAAFTPTTMHMLDRSVLVGVPANRVTVNSANPTMPGGPSPEELLGMYLDGWRIDARATAARARGRIDAAHAGLGYVWDAPR